MKMISKSFFKNAGIYVGIVLFLLVLAYAFVPEVLSGKIVNQADIVGYNGMSAETNSWNNAHPDDPTRWTGSIFSGMPNTSFYPSSDGDLTQSLLNFLTRGKRPASYLFVSLLGAFLLMLSLGINRFLAVGGAIAVTFCSYNFQIIQVGHNSKMVALAFLPWVLAAVIFTYRSALAPPSPAAGKGWRDWLPATVFGAALFGLSLSLQIKANHQQITYYLAIMIVIYAISIFIWLASNGDGRKMFGKFFAASALLLVLGIAGIGTNASKLAPLYQYTSQTMRGGSDLSAESQEGEINDTGLQLEYATAWSYGWNELPNLMIPNFNGGSSSGSVNPEKSAVAKLFRSAGQGAKVKEITSSLPLYWGPQPFTAGPMYVGSITVFLFLLGLLLYKGNEKWWILAATVVAIFLALGNHFMWFTKLFFKYAPMYNKFRTVSMALVIIQFTMPMLAFLVLDRILKQEYSKKEFLKKGWIALGLTAGFCLIMALVPSLAGSFTGSSDSQMQDVIAEALRADRRQILVSDAIWSMLFILMSFVLILRACSVPESAHKPAKNDPNTGNARRAVAMAGICLLILVNLWTVGKRYLNSDDFIRPKAFSSHFDKRTVDEAILMDTDPSYRVIDLTADIFNDNFISYWHKSIGGYNPAKLQRYQDLIDRYLSSEIREIALSAGSASTIDEIEKNLPEIPVLSALNLRYIILGGDIAPVVNHNAFGNAWFVENYIDAATPDEEIDGIGKVDLRRTAVLGSDFKGSITALKQNTPDSLDTDSIILISYAPNELRYHYTASSDRPAIFSEIYYPYGWRAAVDGEERNIFRADWTLRGMMLPAGEHEIVMRFDPEIYTFGENVSRASSIALYLLSLLALCGIAFGRKKE